jgi:hypothetical protein
MKVCPVRREFDELAFLLPDQQWVVEASDSVAAALAAPTCSSNIRSH